MQKYTKLYFHNLQQIINWKIAKLYTIITNITRIKLLTLSITTKKTI